MSDQAGQDAADALAVSDAEPSTSGELRHLVDAIQESTTQSTALLSLMARQFNERTDTQLAVDQRSRRWQIGLAGLAFVSIIVVLGFIYDTSRTNQTTRNDVHTLVDFVERVENEDGPTADEIVRTAVAGVGFDTRGVLCDSLDDDNLNGSSVYVAGEGCLPGPG
jgi:hypothetical protein